MNTQDYLAINGHKLHFPGWQSFTDMIDVSISGGYERTGELRKPWETWKTMTPLCDHETTFNN